MRLGRRYRRSGEANQRHGSSVVTGSSGKLVATISAFLLSAVFSDAQTFGDGTHIVGQDVEPGTYRAPGGEFCYWERLSGFGGSFDELISGDVPSGGTVVTIKGSDAGFKTQGCGLWRVVGGDGPSDLSDRAVLATSDAPVVGSWTWNTNDGKRFAMTMLPDGTMPMPGLPDGGRWQYVESDGIPVLIWWVPASDGRVMVWTFGVRWISENHACLGRPAAYFPAECGVESLLRE